MNSYKRTVHYNLAQLNKNYLKAQLFSFPSIFRSFILISKTKKIIEAKKQKKGDCERNKIIKNKKDGVRAKGKIGIIFRRSGGGVDGRTLHSSQ